MKLKAFLIISFLIAISNINAQNTHDSLITILNHHPADTSEVNALVYLSNAQTNFESALSYAQSGLSLAKKINYKKGIANCNFRIASVYGSNANTIQSIRYLLNALDDYTQLKDNTGIASAQLLLQGNYREAEDYTSSLQHAF